MNIDRRQFLTVAGSFTAASMAPNPLWGDEPKLVEPIHRVANAPAKTTQHPLDRAIAIAHSGLEKCRANVNDYTAILVKRERVGGTLGDHEYMFAKIRNRKVTNGQVTQPLSVYLNFMKPAASKGREIIYVEGRNNGKVIAHEGGFKGKFLPTVSIAPDGVLAMRGQRYPMTEIGVENLIVKLIERGNQARSAPDVECVFRKNAKVKDRVCTLMEVIQPTRRPNAEFYKAQIFIDDELTLPIRMISYDWPTTPGTDGEIIEEYNYINMKVNVGLTDADFDPNNPAYNFH